MDTNIENEPKGISKIIPATIKKDGEISDRGTSAVTKSNLFICKNTWKNNKTNIRRNFTRQYRSKTIL